MNEKTYRVMGHMAAFLTVFIWGTTFTSSKILLETFSPFELLLIRFMIGFAALFIICPGKCIAFKKDREWLFALAGLSGITIHYLTENMAVQYSMASSVGIIKSVSPFFIALITGCVLKEGKLGKSFAVSFFVVMAGIVLVSMNGGKEIGINPAGNMIALFSAFMWAVYSVIVRKISSFGYGVIQTTRRIFFYGIIFMCPLMPVFGFRADWNAIARPEIILNLLFLGVGASAVTFLSWNMAVKRLGPVKTGRYIYLTPVITAAVSAAVLREPITLGAVGGILLIMVGLIMQK